jgi:hypothetical protein
MQPLGLKQGNIKPFALLLPQCNRLNLHGLTLICQSDTRIGQKITHLNVSTEPNSAL